MRKGKEKRLSLKISEFAITLLVLVLLFLSGPAQAFVLELTTPTSEVIQGDKVTFTASVDIKSNEFMNISSFVLNLTEVNGAKNVSCEFYPNGTIISGCSGITIKMISSTSFGYGYSYGYGYGFTDGKMRYNITLDTKNYTIGTYKTSIGFFIGNDEFEQTGGDLVIKSKQGGISGGVRKNCDFKEDESILGKLMRGENGVLIVKEGLFGDTPRTVNKLSINIPSKITKTGRGSITSIRNGEKFSYDFKIVKIEEDDTSAHLYAEGYYKVGKIRKTRLDVVFVLDKTTSLLSFSSDKVILDSVLVVYGGKDCKKK